MTQNPNIGRHSGFPLWSWLLLLAAGLVVAVAYLLGGFTPADRWLSDLAFRLDAHPPSGNLVLVEIDARSLQKLNSWPWSRAYHAALIGRLSEAGTESIAFDVDFSAVSAADAALAQAIAASRSKIVLAGFAQVARNGERVYLSLSRPQDAFLAHARTGLVNIFADSDGEPRQYRRREDRLPNHPATLADLLANPQGNSLANPGDATPNAFGIDYGIDPTGIPRLSYIDVLTGQFDPAIVRGRQVLVGATAIELGDHFMTPRGILAGVEVQALAYETLALRRPVLPAGPTATLAGLAGLMILCLLALRFSWRRGIGVALAAAGTVFLIGILAQIQLGIALDTAPWLSGIVAAAVIGLSSHAQVHAAAASLDRQAARRQKGLMESVFKDSFEGILIADANGRIEVANEAAARILGTDIAALNSQPVGAVLGGLRLDVAPTPESDQTSVVHTVSITRPDGAGPDGAGPDGAGPDGAVLNLAVVVSRSRANRIAGDEAAPEVYVVTFRDESMRHALEATREATVRELQAATAAKNQFMARMSHELRTPLSAIIGFATIIADQRAGPIGNPKYAEYAKDIHHGGERLLDIVSDILDVARIEALEFDVVPDAIEVRTLLASCIATVQQRGACEERRFHLQVEPGAEAIESDQQILRRALAKLLSNAVKFTAADGTITVRALPDDAGGIAIEVTDDGIGIAESALDGVVAAFSQVSGGLDRRHEGSGLGLYFAKRLIELLDGRLEIASRPGAGTTVRLIAPHCLLAASQAA